ncbi:MarR family transcriptional regulator [Parahaliea maris]|uniref:MarR family transcriptional regulator n=1 Tax=Parahaliea maris TaxID=2716870 RepID=A0A5C9A737_9GAMM|nr:MarR family transcriptional regulator [Parahaliea maris]
MTVDFQQKKRSTSKHLGGESLGGCEADGYNSAFLFIGQETLLGRIEEVLVALRRVIRATDLHSKHLAKTTGLTAPQILLLQTIRDKGEVTIGELAADVSLSQATVTSILDRLEKRGLIYRERSKTDKRKVHAYLTDEAMEVLKSAPLPLQAQFTRQFGDLQEWEQTMIISSLQRIAQMMDAQHIDASPVLDIGMLDRQNAAHDRADALHEAENKRHS